MLTTKQVRKIMRDHEYGPIWTNKRANPSIRSVKTYANLYGTDNSLVLALVRAGAHIDDITITEGSDGGPGILVKCKLG